MTDQLDAKARARLASQVSRFADDPAETAVVVRRDDLAAALATIDRLTGELASRCPVHIGYEGHAYTAEDLAELLLGRDAFLVARGLFGEFIDSIKPPPKPSAIVASEPAGRLEQPATTSGQSVSTSQGAGAAVAPTPPASVAGVVEALRACEIRFLEYADNHLAKDPPDRAKAVRNTEMAIMCRRALALAFPLIPVTLEGLDTGEGK